MVKVYPELDLQGAWARKLLTTHLPECMNFMNLWSQGFWSANFFFIEIIRWLSCTRCLQKIWLFVDFCSDLREQSQENLDLRSYRTKVCFEFGEMYGQAEYAYVFTDYQDWWGTWNIPGKMTHFSDIKSKNCRDFGGLFVEAIEINGMQLTAPHAIS